MSEIHEKRICDSGFIETWVTSRPGETAREAFAQMATRFRVNGVVHESNPAEMTMTRPGVNSIDGSKYRTVMVFKDSE